jgi:hypothetical protein
MNATPERRRVGVLAFVTGATAAIPVESPGYR